MCGLGFSFEAPREIAAAVERVELIAAADRFALDENLRDGAALRRLDEPLAFLVVVRHVDLLVRDPPLFQQRLRTIAVGTVARRVNLNVAHLASNMMSGSIARNARADDSPREIRSRCQGARRRCAEPRRRTQAHASRADPFARARARSRSWRG